jgi:hypothetical protein
MLDFFGGVTFVLVLFPLPFGRSFVRLDCRTLRFELVYLFFQIGVLRIVLVHVLELPFESMSSYSKLESDLLQHILQLSEEILVLTGWNGWKFFSTRSYGSASTGNDGAAARSRTSRRFGAVGRIFFAFLQCRSGIFNACEYFG